MGNSPAQKNYYGLMRRADRLFQIVLSLRRRRITTARELARTLEVSERTIYRDVQDLCASGLPIEGAAGVGYRLARGFDLPPMMFDRDELQALRLGARMVRSWADPELLRGRRQRPAQDRGRAAARAGEPRRSPLRAQPARLSRAPRGPPAERRHRAAQGPFRLHPRGRRGLRAHRPAARPLLLGRGVDPGRLVRAAGRSPQLPARPHGQPGSPSEPFTLQAGQTLQDFLKRVRGTGRA